MMNCQSVDEFLKIVIKCKEEYAKLDEIPSTFFNLKWVCKRRKLWRNYVYSLKSKYKYENYAIWDYMNGYIVYPELIHIIRTGNFEKIEINAIIR